jgi:hypothetical protein
MSKTRSDENVPPVREVPVSELLLDPENPRFFHLRLSGQEKQLSQDDLMTEMEKDDAIPTLAKAIRRSGVKDPIWVKELTDGKYLVLEGNRRTYILRQLLSEEKTQPPAGVRYDKVIAHVYPTDASDTEVVLQKARLQAGKKEWGAFNEAAYTYELRHSHGMEEDDIAAELQISIKEVRFRIDCFRKFTDYAHTTDDVNPKKFAYFHEAPPKVSEWINDSSKNLKTYYELISPTSGKQKIRSVALRGGLREFAKVLEDKEAMEALVTDPEVTVEDALAIVEENDIRRGMPFVKRIGPMAASLQGLTESQIEKLKSEKKIQVDIKRLRNACNSILEKIGVEAK